MNCMANSIEKARILIVGDSGVGKTCLTHLIAHNESLNRPGWTVGCNIEVKLHDYKEGTPQQQIYFIELFDIGGSLIHRSTRSVFYAPTHGIILVHDLTNRRSQDNLHEWLYEILNKDGKETYKPGSTFNSTDTQSFDSEQFLGATQIPILVVGTKLDLVDDKRQPQVAQKVGGIADQCSAEEIWLNCHNPRSLAPGTTDAVKLTRYFDRVIEKKTNLRNESNMYANFDRRRQRAMATSTFSSLESSMLLGEYKTSTPKLTGNLLLQGQVL